MELPSKRNYGVDLLRIVATFMICVLHMQGQGGILANAPFMSAQYEVAWLLETLCICGVNCYALISGYVGIKSKYKYTNYVCLWLDVVLVCVLFTVGFAIFMPEAVTPADYLKMIFPATNRQYWYFSSYTVVFLMMPLLNNTVNNLSEKQLRVMLLSVFVLFSVLNTAFYNKTFYDNVWGSNIEPYGLLDGYSGIWLAMLYLAGAYFGKYGFPKWATPKRGLLTFFGSVLLAWGARILIDLFGEPTANPLAYLYLASYVSPLIVLCAIGLLVCFAQMRTSPAAEKVIGFIAPTTFFIYLAQTHPLLWVNVIAGIIAPYATASVPVMVGVILLASLAPFVGGLILGKIKDAISGALGIRKRIAAFEKKHIGNLWEE